VHTAAELTAVSSANERRGLPGAEGPYE